MRRTRNLSKQCCRWLAPLWLALPASCDQPSKPASSVEPPQSTTPRAERTIEHDRRRPVGFTRRDDFENDVIADFWRPGDAGSGRYEPGAVAINTGVARSGNSFVRITVREGDIEQEGDPGVKTERAELDSGKHRVLNRTVRYRYAVRIPGDFPIVSTRLVIAQWKQESLHDGPIVAVRFRRGRHYLTIRKLEQPGADRHNFRLPALLPDTWHDMDVTIRFATDESGFVKVSMNGRHVVDFNGPTAAPREDPRFYNKIGLYRDRMPEPMTIDYDDYTMTVIE